MGFAMVGNALAGAMGPVCTPGNVTVPCEGSAWEFGVQALYLQPAFSTQNSISSLVNVSPTFAVSTLNVINNVPTFQQFNNDWNWGVRLEGAYHYGTGNDLTINWLHFTNNTNLAWFEPATSAGLIPPFIPSNIAATLFLDNQFDQVNLELGQFVDVSKAKKMRFFAGLQYGQVQANATTNFERFVTTGFVLGSSSINAAGLTNNTNFQGWGPVAGIDYAYYLTEALSVTAQGSGSILIGTHRYVSDLLDPTALAILQYAARKENAMVPTLDAQLGVNYAWNIAQGQLNLQVGYEALNYFNALNNQPAGLTDFIQSSDYGLYGPYLGLSYVGNA